MSFKIVSFCSGGYLYAIAHLGVLNVFPIFSLRARLSTFTTAPSIPNVNWSRFSPISLIASIASSIVLQFFLNGTTLNPNSARYSNSSKCELNSTPSIFCTLNIYIFNGLLAVTFGSNCLNDPAAAFLAFANNGSSKISRSSFIFSKSAVEMKTSPRTVISISFFNFCGIVLIVLTFPVTSSPTCPLPLVAPSTKIPFSYFNAHDKPSIFVSTQ